MSLVGVWHSPVMCKGVEVMSEVAKDFRRFVRGRKFATIMADPPWQFDNKTGKVAPEHKRLTRYPRRTRRAP